MRKRYTVITTWMTWARKRMDYARHSRTHKVFADSLTEACDQALARTPPGICPAVSCAWYDWPFVYESNQA